MHLCSVEVNTFTLHGKINLFSSGRRNKLSLTSSVFLDLIQTLDKSGICAKPHMWIHLLYVGNTWAAEST